MAGNGQNRSRQLAICPVSEFKARSTLPPGCDIDQRVDLTAYVFPMFLRQRSEDPINPALPTLLAALLGRRTTFGIQDDINMCDRTCQIKKAPILIAVVKYGPRGEKAHENPYVRVDAGGVLDRDDVLVDV